MKTMREKYFALELERQDYRKPVQQLSEDKERERQAVIGWLYANDTIWSLGQEISQQITALAAYQVEEHEQLRIRKKASAILRELADSLDVPPSQEEANQFRALLIDGNLEGMLEWQHQQNQKKPVKSERATPKKQSH